MTTIVNTPPARESGGNTGLVIGLVFLLLVVYLFIFYGLPAIRGMSLGTPQINVPSEIDVNVNQGE